jgi:single-strand DNA-binding protein
MTDAITITGNITEPELRHLPSGDAVLSFRIGRAHRAFDKALQKWVEKSTSWYTVSAFRGLAEHAFASLHRGQRVVVHGRLRLREWENSSGVHGFAAEIEAESLGHDLLFGTSTFEKAGGRADDGVASAADSWAPSDDAATPLPVGSEESDADGRDREFALAGMPADSAEPPF